MKKKAVLIFVVIFVIASVAAAIAIEKNRNTPMERFIKTLQTTKHADDYVPVKILNNDKNVQYEFLSYDLIDDKDIEKQTKYKAEFFVDGKVPPSDYIVKWTDYDAMARDYPKYDEYRNSDGNKGMTKSEAEEFMRIHEPEYTIDKHIKSKYLFVRCRITYMGNGRKKEFLSLFDVFAMRGNERIGPVNDEFCYFDHPQPALWEDGRAGDFFWYRFDRVGDSLECVLGCRLRGEYFDLSEENMYYIGFQPGAVYPDLDQFNPAHDKRCVALNDMPREAN